MSATLQLLAPIRHVARLTLEAATPLSVASGEADADHDTLLFRDWNGLPCLSGAGVAGVLRALHADHHAGTDALFGNETPGSRNGAASRLLVSFGLAHDSRRCAHGGLLDPDTIEKDDVLKLLATLAPVPRDHVAIGENGAAREHAKFDRCACPVGTRFSLDLAIDGDDDSRDADHQALMEVVALFDCPYARFGGGARRGYGRLRAIAGRSWHGALDRRGEAGRRRWIAFRSAPPHAMPAGFQAMQRKKDLESRPPSKRAPFTARLELQAQGFWRVGQGRAAWTAPPPDHPKAPDRVALSEAVIRWDTNPAHIRREARPSLAVVPGAGIKGALAHRAEYHLRRIGGCFGGQGGARLMDRLLGSATDGGGGRAGALLIDDVSVDFPTKKESPPRAARRTRNSIDRAVGGVRGGKLFIDEALWRGPMLVVPITVLTRDGQGKPLGVAALKALDWAIDDLRSGRLALGAGDAIGDGVFAAEGPVSWNDGTRQSLAEAAEEEAGP